MKGEVQLAGAISGPSFPWAQGGGRGELQRCSGTMSPGGLSTLKNVFTLVRLHTGD